MTQDLSHPSIYTLPHLSPNNTLQQVPGTQKYQQGFIIYLFSTSVSNTHVVQTEPNGNVIINGDKRKYLDGDYDELFHHRPCKTKEYYEKPQDNWQLHQDPKQLKIQVLWVQFQVAGLKVTHISKNQSAFIFCSSTVLGLLDP